jgi:hypothetical protein
MHALCTYVRQVNVHELDKNIDNAFVSFGDPRVSIIGTVEPENSATYFNYRLHILTGGKYRHAC